jgi:hypothetical protein
MDEKARDKVVAKACKWLDSRRAKAAAIGELKTQAQYRHKKDGDELAEAVEKLRKLPP